MPYFKKIDVLLLVEHPARELEFCQQFQKQNDELKIEIKSLYFDILEIVRFVPKVVILPYSYYPPETWPYDFLLNYYDWETLYISINWEQYIFPFTKTYKVPKPTKRKIRQCWWLNEYKELLLKNNYLEDDLISIRDPHIKKYYDRDLKKPMDLLGKYRKDFDKIIFCPVNFAWYFQNQKFIDLRIKGGLHPNDAKALLNDLNLQMQFWIKTIKEFSHITKKIAFIVRPHPSVDPARWEAIIKDNKLLNTFVETEGTAEDWAVSADLIVSNYSTVISYSNQVGLNSFILREKPLIDQINSNWLKNLPTLSNANEIVHALDTPKIATGLSSIVSSSYTRIELLKNTDLYISPSHPRLSSVVKFLFNKTAFKHLLLSLGIYRKASIERDRFKSESKSNL